MNETAVAVEREGDTTEDEVQPRRLLVPILVGALVLALALATTFFVLWLQTADPSATDVNEYLAANQPAVEERSTEVAKLLFTYDSTTLDEVADRILALSTGNFRVEYERLIYQRGLKEALESAKASSRGVILEGPDVSFVGANEAQVLFNIRQTVQNKNTPGGTSVVYVTRLTLVNTEDEGWKADRIELLSYDEV